MLVEGRLSFGSQVVFVLVDIMLCIDMGGVNKIFGFMGDRVEEGFGMVEEVVDVIVCYFFNWVWFKDLLGFVKNFCLYDDGWYCWYWDLVYLYNCLYSDLDFVEEV